jgi:hypothetical protein
VAVLTRCSVPPSLQTLHNLPKEYALPTLGFMDVAICRSKASQSSRAVTALYELFAATVR